LDGYGWVEEKGSDLFKNSQRVKVFDILGFGSKISQLLSKLDFGFVELFECDLESLHVWMIRADEQIKLQKYNLDQLKYIASYNYSDLESYRILINKIFVYE
jgi:hypothetical protein